MCIAIYKPKGKFVPKKNLKSCRLVNGDGMGLVYAHKGKLTIYKEMSSFDKFYKKYRKLVNDIDPPMAIHFRIGTHGYIDEENCHPFFVNKDLAFCHNGVINSIDVPKNSDHSDTIHFNEKILKALPANFLDSAETIKLIENFIGWSKLVFLRSDGSYKIINEDDGEWDDGIWYSNSSYKPISKIPSASNNEYGYNDAGYWGKSYLHTDVVRCEGCDWQIYTDEEKSRKLCYYCYNKIDKKNYHGNTDDKKTEYKCRVCNVKLMSEGTHCTSCYNKLEGVNNNYEDSQYMCDTCGIHLCGETELETGKCYSCEEKWQASAEAIFGAGNEDQI